MKCLVIHSKETCVSRHCFLANARQSVSRPCHAVRMQSGQMCLVADYCINSKRSANISAATMRSYIDALSGPNVSVWYQTRRAAAYGVYNLVLNIYFASSMTLLLGKLSNINAPFDTAQCPRLPFAEPHRASLSLLIPANFAQLQHVPLPSSWVFQPVDSASS